MIYKECFQGCVNETIINHLYLRQKLNLTLGSLSNYFLARCPVNRNFSVMEFFNYPPALLTGYFLNFPNPNNSCIAFVTDTWNMTYDRLMYLPSALLKTIFVGQNFFVLFLSNWIFCWGEKECSKQFIPPKNRK